MNNLKPIAVKDGYKVSIQQQAAAIPGDFSSFNPVEITAPRAKAAGKDILCNKLVYTAAGCTLAGYSLVAGGGYISSTAEKITCDNLNPIREGDRGTCTGTFQQTAYPFSMQPCNCATEIKSAGQKKVEAE